MCPCHLKCYIGFFGYGFMENGVKLEESVTKFLKNGKLNNEYEKEFAKFHAFTKYKLRTAKYFIEKLKEIEQSGKTQTAFADFIDRMMMFWDCVDYMLMGAYDGLLYEIYHVLRWDFPDNKRFFEDLMGKLSKNDDDIIRSIQNALTQAKKDWEGKLYTERNRWTHQRLTVRNVSWRRGEKSYLLMGEQTRI